jgi:heme/copper-type cytochrome/quinol oxidase subunit 1
MAGTIDQEIGIGAVDDAQALPLVGKLHEWVVTVDHKRLGLLYIAGGLFFFLIAGLQAITMRLQLAVPNAGIVPPQVFNRLMTMHGTAMIFLVGMPILTGFFNYLVPLMIGARDLAFPKGESLRLRPAQPSKPGVMTTTTAVRTRASVH